MNHPALLILMTAAGLYLARLWQADRVAARQGGPHPGALPGATDAPMRAVVIAIAGALLLLAAETFGEIALGISAEQSRPTWLFAAYSIAAAPVIEEIVFRGWLVIDRRGPAWTWAGAIGASLLFALLHPFLWRWEEQGFQWQLTGKGAFSTAAIFALSLWLYAARLASWNPARSLLPCLAAHAVRNAGVIAIKAGTGHLGGLW